MTLSEELEQINTIFIDTAPIIYYIEANPQFGTLVKVVIDSPDFRTFNLSSIGKIQV